MHVTSPRVRAVIELLDEMNEEERTELRNELEGTCGPGEWNRTWHEELGRRLAQIDAGQVELVDGEEFLAQLRRSSRSEKA